MAGQDSLAFYVLENQAAAAAGMSRNANMMCIAELLGTGALPSPAALRAGVAWASLVAASQARELRDSEACRRKKEAAPTGSSSALITRVVACLRASGGRGHPRLPTAHRHRGW